MPPAIRVTVELMGPFESAFDTPCVTLELPAPATVATLVEALAARWPAGARLAALLGDPASPRRRYCYVSLDYAVLAPDAVLGTPLHDGARVCIGTPMVGG